MAIDSQAVPGSVGKSPFSRFGAQRTQRNDWRVLLKDSDDPRLGCASDADQRKSTEVRSLQIHRHCSRSHCPRCCGSVSKLSSTSTMSIMPAQFWMLQQRKLRQALKPIKTLLCSQNLVSVWLANMVWAAQFQPTETSKFLVC